MSYIGSTPTTQSFIAGTDYFNGTGAQINFTLSRSVNSVNDIEVIVNNVEQIPSGYSVSGTTLTFSAAPSAGTSNVYVRYLSTTNLSLAIPAGTSASFNTLAYTGTLTGGTGVVNLGSGQFYKDASGNVGIGGAATNEGGYARVLQVTGSTEAALELKTGSNFSYVAQNGTTLQIKNNATAGVMTFATEATERARIDSSGNVGIGTSSPANIVGIIGPPATSFISIQRSDEAGFGGRVGCGNSLYGPATTRSLGLDGFSSISFGIAGTERARLDSGGNLLVGKTVTTFTTDGVWLQPAGTAWLSRTSDVTFVLNRNGTDGSVAQFYKSGSQVGSISVTGSATAYNTSSDYRLKEAIAPMTGALAKVALLKPCTYKWKVDGSDGQGFIAHELAEVEAGCVTGEKDAVDAEGNPQYQGIDTSFLVATLTAAIQEQQTLITALTARITALEAK